MSPEKQQFYEFGQFRLDPSTPLLLREGRPVSLTPKALETLVVLVAHGGQVVSRKELIEAVWPDVAVEENNLSVNVSTLRKALGSGEGDEKYIETVPRRGYRFTAAVRAVPVESVELTYTRHTRSLTLVEETSEADAEPPLPSARAFAIAVLPFKQIEAREGEDYLGIGLCDTLITRLSRVGRFVLRPTSSVVRYGDGQTEPLAAGRELKVDYVVDGRIRLAGETLRVSVQLLRVSEEAICWAGQFDEKLTDVLQLEDSIAEQVAIALVPQMTADERERLAKRGTDNPEAFEAYLRGRFHFNSLTEDGFAKALAAYERAVQLDPSYALAHTGIADYYYFLAVWGVMPPNKCLAASETAARRAVEIDPELAEAHAALGFALSGRFKWAEGERHVLRALELSPNSALAHLRYGNHLVQQGFVEEAVQHARRSIELDPLSPIYQFSLGWGLYFARRFDECLQQFQSMTTEHPLNPMAYFGLAWVARHVGRHDEALGAMKRAEELSNGSLMMTTGRGQAHAAAGMRREAEEVLEKVAALPAECYVIPYHVALIHHFLGDREKTLLALEEAFEQRDLWLVWIGVEPAFDSLRSDPRFQRLLELTGLSQSAEITHTRHTRSLTLVEESSETDAQTVVVAQESAHDAAQKSSANLSVTQTSVPLHTRLLSRARWPVLLAVVVAVASLAVGAGLFVRGRQSETEPVSERRGAGAVAVGDVAVRSLAVLPFKAGSALRNFGQYNGGEHEELTNAVVERLSATGKLNIAPQEALLAEKATPNNILLVGHKLNLDAVLTGAIFRDDAEQIRLRMHLISVNGGEVLWADTVACSPKNLPGLADSITRNVLAGLHRLRSAEEYERRATRHTANRDAYQHYLQGRFIWEQRDDVFAPNFATQTEGMAASTNQLEQARSLDPNFALAYLGLADHYKTSDYKEGEWRLGEEYALKALALDPNLAEAHAALAFIRMFHYWDWAGAEVEFKRALELNPDCVTAHQWYALFHALRGNHGESIKEITRARELAPFSISVAVNAAEMFYFHAGSAPTGRYTNAINPLILILELHREASRAEVVLSHAYWMHNENRDREQTVELETEGSWKGSPEDYARMRAGPRKGSREFDNIQYRDTYNFAQWNAVLDRREEALDLLERDYDEHHFFIIYIKAEPFFTNLRDEPRYQTLLRKLGLS